MLNAYFWSDSLASPTFIQICWCDIYTLFWPAGAACHRYFSIIAWWWSINEAWWYSDGIKVMHAQVQQDQEAYRNWEFGKAGSNDIDYYLHREYKNRKKKRIWWWTIQIHSQKQKVPSIMKVGERTRYIGAVILFNTLSKIPNTRFA